MLVHLLGERMYLEEEIRRRGSFCSFAIKTSNFEKENFGVEGTLEPLL
jgi:hypothetical protein